VPVATERNSRVVPPRPDMPYQAEAAKVPALFTRLCSSKCSVKINRRLDLTDLSHHGVAVIANRELFRAFSALSSMVG